MKRLSAAFFLSLTAACAPAAIPQKTFVDSYYQGTVNGQASSFDGRSWAYETSDYTLRYWLGTHPDNVAPASVKLEIGTKNPVTIGWNESIYHYADGTTSPVTHEGVPYGFRPADTELAAGSTVRDRVVPQKNLIYSGGAVTNAYYLVPRSEFGTTTIGLDLVLNGETVALRFDGLRD